jgi:hypothetical protein
MSSHSNDQIISYGIIQIDEPVIVEPVVLEPVALSEAIKIIHAPTVGCSVANVAPVLMDVHEPAPLPDDCVEYLLHVIKEVST